MRLQDLISSKPMTRVGIFIGQHMPRRVGYGISRFIANLIGWRKPELYWTVQANLRQIVGPEIDTITLHQMAWNVFYHAGQTYYDFFSALSLSKEEMAQMVRVPKKTLDLIRAEEARGQGALLLLAHMSNFDLVGLAVAARGFSIQVLSLANPQAGFNILNYLRSKIGLLITPITTESLRKALRRLKSGGLVATGVDRPVPGDRELIEFFGRLAYLPVGPVRMALLTGATVLVGGCHFDPGQGYVLEVSDPVKMVRTGDRRRDVMANARRVAAVVEDLVRDYPDQWMMFHPVWPKETSD